MLSLLAMATWLFVLTHVDTFVVLVAFCADGRYTRAEILLGHYLGFVVGLSAAVAVAAIAAESLREWAFLLGFLPIGLGVWAIVRRSEATTPIVPDRTGGPLAHVSVVAASGIGLSGENVAVFVPFFIGLSAAELAVVVVLYMAAAGGLYLAARMGANRSVMEKVPPAVKRWLVPGSLIVVGLVVLRSGL